MTQRPMDKRVAVLETARRCDTFIANVKKTIKDHAELAELVRQACRRKVLLLAEKHGAQNTLEREAIEAIFALESVTGKRASRTWPMLERHGIIATVERVVNREHDSSGYAALVEMGMEDMLFERVVLRHPDQFSPKAVKRSEARLRTLGLPL